MPLGVKYEKLKDFGEGLHSVKQMLQDQLTELESEDINRTHHMKRLSSSSGRQPNSMY